MGKIIKLTEQDLVRVVKRILTEQTAPYYYPEINPQTKQIDSKSEYVFSQGGPIVKKQQGAIDAKKVFPNITDISQYPKKVSADVISKAFQAERLRAQIFTPKSTKDALLMEIAKILYNARDKAWVHTWKKDIANNFTDMYVYAVNFVKWAKANSSFINDEKLLRGVAGLLMRESKATPLTFLNPKEIIGALTNIFGDDRSQGFGQIKPSVAKQYGITNENLYSYIGSLNAISKILSSDYQKAKNYYRGPTVTIFENNALKKVPAIGNDAALHMALAAYNANADKVLKNWCQTNVPGLANPCNVPRVEEDGKVRITDKTKPIPNYFPNIGNVHSYMPEIRNLYNNLAPLPAKLKELAYLI